MRLMQVMAGSRHGGAEAFFERLTIALGARGVTQRVVIRREPARAARLRAAGLSVRELPFGGPLDLYTPFALRREIALQQSDVVLAWMNRGAAKTPRSHAVLCGRLGGYYDLKYYRHCDHLIGNTRDIVDYIRRQGWPAAQAHYLPNFVNAERQVPQARAALGTPEDALLLLALGRLHAVKGFDTLIRATPSIPGAHAWIAGEGPEEGALKALAARCGVSDRVHFLGWRADVGALLAGADIFVCPSRHEPLGNVVIEAFAQARPVVSTASQGPSALVRDGVNGCLVPVDDAAALADVIRALAASPARRAELAQAGYQTYLENFTEDAVTAAYRDFFERVKR